MDFINYFDSVVKEGLFETVIYKLRPKECPKTGYKSRGIRMFQRDWRDVQSHQEKRGCGVCTEELNAGQFDRNLVNVP